jgi:hypothetical protein
MERAILGSEEIQTLEFLAEHRVAITSQVQALLGGSPQATERRIRRLAEAGLVARQKIFEVQPAACWITRQGLGAIECRLPAPTVDLKGYRHDVGLGWLWLAARGGEFGELRAVVSERTMRSADRRDPTPGRTYGVGVGGGGRLHYPDLLLETATGHRVAVELELTGKGRRRLERIMLGYAADPRVDGVLYLCPRGPLGRRVQDAARRMGVSDRVSVQLLAPGSPEGTPEPGRVATRRLGRATTRQSERTPTRQPVRTRARTSRSRGAAAEL